ncbi:MAG TPA: MYXO-CTERM sorting domain-containing protein [Kofleriaceae bacterium]|nr:MYXO-CTERM sorting domain-containing protein [Kofleriaceae bacterium]
MTWRSARRGVVVTLVVLGAIAAQRPAAALVLEGPPKNGLSSEAFRRNALTTNLAALARLRKSPLDASLFTGPEHIGRRLHDPRARAMMEEIIRCALDGSAPVDYVDPIDQRTYRWRGELGLCQQPAAPASDWTQDWPVWDQNGPNLGCQQLVTACVTARINGLGESIPLSLRGQPSALFPPHDAPVPAEKAFRESPPGQDPAQGTPIGSFTGPLCLEHHECDWEPAFVGTCTGQVKLAIQDPAVCGATPVRVCAGIHGCYGTPSGYPVPPEFPEDLQRSYVKHLVDRTGACVGSEISFTCRPGIPPGGYFSVMTRPIQTGSGLHPIHPPSPAIEVSGQGRYPAPEHEVFAFREGAFYGNLFDPAALLWSCDVVGGKRVCTPVHGNAGVQESCELDADPAGARAPKCVETRTVPYREVYACYSLAQQQDSQGSGDDDDGAAYLNARICDQPHPDKPCFFHRPRRCHFADPATNQARGAGCEWDAAAGAYRSCPSLESGVPTLYPPITTYLNGPCDVLGDHDACAKLRTALARGPVGVPSTHPGPRPGCGCALGGGAGSPAGLVALAAVMAWVRRRRRARGS